MSELIEPAVDNSSAQGQTENGPGPASTVETPANDSVGQSPQPIAGRAQATASDFPPPASLTTDKDFIWDEDDLPQNNYRALGERLAASDDLFRQPTYGSGLLLASHRPNIEPMMIGTSRGLAPVIADRVRVHVVKGGNTKRNSISSSHLNTMLGSEVFLQRFRPVDEVIKTAHYLPGFVLMKPGYNDGGSGRRFVYAGPEVGVERSLAAIPTFLNVMDFATSADRTNAVAAALTVMLRHFWPGAKPVIVATSSKSHGGKDTVIQFAAGTTPLVSISYQGTDWALERSFVGAVKHCPQTGVVVIENARISKGSKYIASGFLERLITDPEPLFFSTGTGNPVRRHNHQVLAISTNYGMISEDLVNRGLPIHLSPVGNVADRESPIGNPKLEYLPANRTRIDAELRGMIERWKEAGQPLCTNVRHPFSEWARTIGGILQVNGFGDFLANYSLRRTADEPVRQALGVLGSARPNQWLRADDWARLTVNLGLVKALIPEGDRGTDAGRARGIGVVLTAHRDETFEIETDDKKLTLLLSKARRRFEEGAEAATKYHFEVVKEEALKEDPEKPPATSLVSANGQHS